MPEVEVTVKAFNKVKDGESQYGPWQLWLIEDGNETKYSLFHPKMKDAIELVKNNIDRRFRLTYEDKDGKKAVSEVAGPLEDKQEPALGDGSYVKGKTNPDDNNAINSRAALAQAVAAVTHTIPSDATPKQAWEKIGPLFAQMKLALNGKPAVDFDAETDDSIPF